MIIGAQLPTALRLELTEPVDRDANSVVTDERSGIMASVVHKWERGPLTDDYIVVIAASDGRMLGLQMEAYDASSVGQTVRFALTPSETPDGCNGAVRVRVLKGKS